MNLVTTSYCFYVLLNNLAWNLCELPVMLFFTEIVDCNYFDFRFKICRVLFPWIDWDGFIVSKVIAFWLMQRYWQIMYVQEDCY